MTIQVDIEHGDQGHPAPIYVTPLDPQTLKPNGLVMTVKDGDRLSTYVHQFKAYLVSERPLEPN